MASYDYQNNNYKTSSENAENLSSIEAQDHANWGDLGAGLNDKIVRIKFIRKVYLIVSTQLVFTFGICLLFVSVDSIKEWVTTSQAGLILYLFS